VFVGTTGERGSPPRDNTLSEVLRLFFITAGRRNGDPYRDNPMRNVRNDAVGGGVSPPRNTNKTILNYKTL
jgi:hypothetical protein